jgi:hypothetical protein
VAQAFSLCSVFLRVFRQPLHLFRRVYRRNLPHWYPRDAAVFVTWRLCGSLPRLPALPIVAEEDAGRAFRDLDVHLDRAEFGPTWLAWPPIANVLVETIRAAEAERDLCTLHAFVVMPNHVHLLITPSKHLSAVMKWIKGVSARRANLLLTRTGGHFGRMSRSTTGLETGLSSRRFATISGTTLPKRGW